MSIENTLDSDEVDLAELIRNIWRGRWIIVAWIAAAILLALCYAILRTPYYKIESIISPVQSSSLTPIQPSVVNIPDVHSVPKLDEKIVYNSTLLQLSSINVLRDFWSIRFPGESEESADDFRTFVEELSVLSVNPKGDEPQSRRIAGNFSDPKIGENTLDAYLQFLNNRIQMQVLEELNSSVKANAVAIDSTIALLEEDAQKKLSYDLLKLKENYEIAKSLKITVTPYKDLENIGLKILDGRDYLLGTDALLLQINTLSARQGNSMRAYDKKINDLFLARSIVESDISRLADFKAVVPMFKIENRAESSIDPIGPDIILLLVAGLVAGLFFGCLHVLLVNLMKQNGD